MNHETSLNKLLDDRHFISMIDKAFSRQKEIDDDIAKKNELAAILSAADYRLKHLAAKKDEKSQESKDELFKTCRKYGWTPQFGISGRPSFWPISSFLSPRGDLAAFSEPHEHGSDTVKINILGTKSLLPLFKIVSEKKAGQELLASFSPDSEFLAIVSGNWLTIWQIAELRIIFHGRTHEKPPENHEVNHSSVSWSNDSTSVAVVGSRQEEVYVFSVSSSSVTLSETITSPVGRISDIALDRNGSELLILGNDIAVTNFHSPPAVFRYPHPFSGSAVAFFFKDSFYYLSNGAVVSVSSKEGCHIVKDHSRDIADRNFFTWEPLSSISHELLMPMDKYPSVRGTGYMTDDGRTITVIFRSDSGVKAAVLDKREKNISMLSLPPETFSDMARSICLIDKEALLHHLYPGIHYDACLDEPDYAADGSFFARRKNGIIGLKADREKSTCRTPRYHCRIYSFPRNMEIPFEYTSRKYVRSDLMAKYGPVEDGLTSGKETAEDIFCEEPPDIDLLLSEFYQSGSPLLIDDPAAFYEKSEILEILKPIEKEVYFNGKEILLTARGKVCFPPGTFRNGSIVSPPDDDNSYMYLIRDGNISRVGPADNGRSAILDNDCIYSVFRGRLITYNLSDLTKRDEWDIQKETARFADRWIASGVSANGKIALIKISLIREDPEKQYD